MPGDDTPEPAWNPNLHHFLFISDFQILSGESAFRCLVFWWSHFYLPSINIHKTHKTLRFSTANPPLTWLRLFRGLPQAHGFLLGKVLEMEKWWKKNLSLDEKKHVFSKERFLILGWESLTCYVEMGGWNSGMPSQNSFLCPSLSHDLEEVGGCE